MKKKITVLTTMLALLVAGLLLVTNSAPSASAQDANLLTNGGFEGAFGGFTPIFDYQKRQCADGICNTAQMPSGWTPWWTEQASSDEEWANRMPEYKPVCPYAPCPWPERLGGGGQAFQYFTFYGTHQAGFYQTTTVPANANLRFSVLGQAWSTNGDTAKSPDPTTMNMRIGIDPTGGQNPFAASVVWSPFLNPYDAYAPFEVVATAQGDKVTVFTWSNPAEARKHNDVYWDEAALVTVDGSVLQTTTVTDPVTGVVSTVAAPAVDPNVRFAAGPTPTPNAEGVIEVLVESGDTLWSIAARAGLTLDELLALNPNLNRNSFIGWGDRIVLGRLDGQAAGGNPESAEAEPAAEEAAEETAPAEDGGGETEAVEVAAVEEEAPEPTAAPLPSATPDGGAICLLAFDDMNGDGQFGAGEALRSAVAFTLAKDQTVVSNYITDGVNEPFCIEGLESGNYRISRSMTANEVATNGSDWGASVIPGSRQEFHFGSRIDETAMAEEIAVADTSDAAMEEGTESEAMAGDASAAGAMEEAGADAEAESGGVTSWLVWIILAIALILIIGVALVIMSARRSTID